MGRLKHYIKPEVLYILITLVIKFVATYVELWIPSLMEVMLREETVAAGTKQIWFYGGLMLLCAIGCLVLNITANRMTAFSSGRITKKIRHDLFAKLQTLSAKQMDELTIPSAESRLTSDTYNVNVMLTRLQRMGIRAPILLIGGIIMMIRMDLKLSLVMIALLPIITITVILVTKKSIPLHEKQQTILDKAAGIKTAELTRTKASVLHVTPFNSFPSGVTASVSKRHEYLRWAEKQHGYIIEDNYDSELTVSMKHEDTVYAMSQQGSVIYLNTFSETIAPSIRVGYMVLPDSLLSDFESKLGFYSCTVPVFEQYVLASLLSTGDFERHINRVRRKRRKSI